MTEQNLSDTHLWQALKQGDQLALGELYERYYQVLYSYGYKLLPDTDSVEDAIQDLFVVIWRTRQNLAEADSVKFYLFSSLRRQIHRLSEKNKRSGAISFPLYVIPTPLTAEQQLVEQEQEELLTLRLMQVLHQLPQRQLEVVLLRFYENFKTDDIATIVGITEKSVRNTLHKALAYLRNQAQYLAPFLSLLFLWLWLLAD